MVNKSPKDRVIPFPNGLNSLQMVVTNYLLTGMILQVGGIFYHGFDKIPKKIQP